MCTARSNQITRSGFSCIQQITAVCSSKHIAHLKNKFNRRSKRKRGRAGASFLFKRVCAAGTSQNLEANLAACNDNVNANKQTTESVMCGCAAGLKFNAWQGCRRLTGLDGAGGAKGGCGSGPGRWTVVGGRLRRLTGPTVRETGGLRSLRSARSLSPAHCRCRHYLACSNECKVD